jgi:uncharacterized repeat protein (TIGR03803 family)
MKPGTLCPVTWQAASVRWRRAIFIALLVLGATAIGSFAQVTFNTLVNFNGSNGNMPASVVQGRDGNLYGTTAIGGPANWGTVYNVTSSGKFTGLYDFCKLNNCTDGAFPLVGLVLNKDGDFYGTTNVGGANNEGIVYKTTPTGTLSTVYNFCSMSSCRDGSNPVGGVIRGTDGNFYGTTYGGGNNGAGTVYKVTTSGALTSLYSFCQQTNCSDGGNPQSTLVQATDGDFYGTTTYGGTGNSGTVFKITSSGTLTSLYSFCKDRGCPDGMNPYVGLVQATDGAFYGTTRFGGHNGSGTIFRITPEGALTTLYHFCALTNCADGASPLAALIQATDGNLYGTTFGGGSGGVGTVFSMPLGGRPTVLHSFDTTDGGDPAASLYQATSGSFYGTTLGGGNASDGTVFNLSTGLGSFASLVATAGKEGTNVGILGQSFTKSSVVKFAGVEATTLTLMGSTFINATVPTGALTGQVTVTTGATTLATPQTFDVTPTSSSCVPSSGPVGTLVTITGTGLIQTTTVTFNVTSATFTPNSDSQVVATVPTGATTGKVKVTSKGGSVAACTFTVS